MSLSVLMLAAIGAWHGVALSPSLLRFSCEQTSEKTTQPVVAAVRDFKSKTQAYWVRPIGASRAEGPRYQINLAVDVEHIVWVTPEPAMTNGENRVFKLPDGRECAFRYDATAPSPVIKLNQLGYAPCASEKYAYLGEWIGLAGEYEFHPKKFCVIRDSDGAVMLEGEPHRRHRDSYTPEGTPWTGERPWEFNFSELNEPGRYHLEVEGVGRSLSFTVGVEPFREAFAVHMAGMARQRCGVKCHRTAKRGNFPPDDFHYGSSPGRRWGFFDSNNRSIGVNHFRLIRENRDSAGETVEVPGGWHDAADYDRRPFHLQAVGDFAALALLKPGCRAAVDEAWWGLRHLIAVQQADGGVGTWIETISHPSVGEGPCSEREDFEYFIATPTRASTLEFAAYAAMTALALENDDNRRSVLTNAAIRAWNYAIDRDNDQILSLNYCDEIITYRPNPTLPGELLLKAGLDLSLLTGNDDFMTPVLDEIERVTEVVTRGNWRWSPFILIELEIFERKLDPELIPIRKTYNQHLLLEANQMLGQIATAWAYRTPWYPARNFHAKDMGWGYALPLSRARTLIAAHAISWKQKYLDGAFLANDFHCGANPEGETYTNGLGTWSTQRYLDLEGKYPPGVTPYRLVYGLEWRCLAYCFPDSIWEQWPIWRRYGNFEILSVRNSEFSVWETIAPAAVVTGYLAEQVEKGNQ